MSKVIKLNETQVRSLVRKIIKEVQHFPFDDYPEDDAPHVISTKTPLPDRPEWREDITKTDEEREYDEFVETYGEKLKSEGLYSSAPYLTVVAQLLNLPSRADVNTFAEYNTSMAEWDRFDEGFTQDGPSCVKKIAIPVDRIPFDMCVISRGTINYRGKSVPVIHMHSETFEAHSYYCPKVSVSKRRFKSALGL